MTTRTTRQQRTVESIVETDRRQAAAAAEDRVIAEACELAPLSYDVMRALHAAGRLGDALAALPDELVRAQTVRFLVERKAATGMLWGWGCVDDAERRFRRLIAQARATQLAALVGAAAAAQLASLLHGQPAYTLPAPALVRDALARLAAVAQAAGDTANANALTRADYQLGQGLYAQLGVAADGALLVPSRTAAGTVYRVGETGCGCEAGQHGRPCWHGALAEAIALAREEAAALADEFALAA